MLVTLSLLYYSSVCTYIYYTSGYTIELAKKNLKFKFKTCVWHVPLCRIIFDWMLAPYIQCIQPPSWWWRRQQHSNFKFNEISIPVFSLVERGPAWICKASVLNFDSLEPFFMGLWLGCFFIGNRQNDLIYSIFYQFHGISMLKENNDNCFSNCLHSPEIICICKRISVLLYTYYLVCFWIEKE